MICRFLNNHPSAQCHIEQHDFNSPEMTFVSYTTPVLIIKNGEMEVTGLYSATTRKQITWFLREYLPHISYQDVKKAYEKGTKIKL